jgi:hypothetical protein
MLSQLLNEIAHGNTLDIDRLAARLNTSPGMVKAMLEHLERSGAFTQYQSCGEGCSGCGLASQCHSGEKGNRLWEYEIPSKG